MQVCIDVTCMHTNFGGCGLFGFGDTATFKNDQISLSDHGLYIVHGHQKIQSIRIGPKNSCKYALMSHACTPIFCGRGLFGFGDTATLKNGQISLSDHGL